MGRPRAGENELQAAIQFESTDTELYRGRRDVKYPEVAEGSAALDVPGCHTILASEGPVVDMNAQSFPLFTVVASLHFPVSERPFVGMAAVTQAIFVESQLAQGPEVNGEPRVAPLLAPKALLGA